MIATPFDRGGVEDEDLLNAYHFLNYAYADGLIEWNAGQACSTAAKYEAIIVVSILWIPE